MIRVLIADAHPIVRQGLRSALSEAPDLTVVGECATGVQAIERVREGDVDVVLLDISMPGVNGFVALQQIHEQFPAIRVLVLSTYSEKQYAARALKAGALGYLTKLTAPAELISAIRTVSSGSKYITPALAKQLEKQRNGSERRSLHEQLSDREFQVMLLLGGGKTISETAVVLALSVPTVKTYRARVLAKMQLESTSQLMIYVIENQLLEPTE